MACFCFRKGYRQRNVKFIEYILRQHAEYANYKNNKTIDQK